MTDEMKLHTRANFARKLTKASAEIFISQICNQINITWPSVKNCSSCCFLVFAFTSFFGSLRLQEALPFFFLFFFFFFFGTAF